VTRIVGISLVRNEERYIERVLRNALGLCDRILVLDNLSTDDTGSIVDRLGKETGRVGRQMVHHLGGSHAHVQEFIGTDTWVFGVDGDEVYDPAGLRRLRDRLLGGEFRDNWMVRGHFLHVTALDSRLATGWMAPPSHDPNKLYNFGMVQSWPPDRRTLFHGEGLVLRGGRGYSEAHRRLVDEAPWERSDMRCLHLRFIARSRVDAGIDRLAEPRVNPYSVAKVKEGYVGWTKYRRGDEVTVDARPFFGAEAGA
jgi:hypothetical protein